MQHIPTSDIGVHEDPHIRRSACRLPLRFFHTEITVVFQQFQRRKQFLRLFEKLTPAYLEQLGTLDLRDTPLFQLRQNELRFLNAQIRSHHGIGVICMGQKVCSDLNGPATRRIVPMYLLAQSDIDVRRPPHYEGWNCSIRFNGHNIEAKYNADLCQMLEDFEYERLRAETYFTSQDYFDHWFETELAYYAKTELPDKPDEKISFEERIRRRDDCVRRTMGNNTNGTSGHK